MDYIRGKLYRVHKNNRFDRYVGPKRVQPGEILILLETSGDCYATLFLKVMHVDTVRELSDTESSVPDWLEGPLP